MVVKVRPNYPRWFEPAARFVEQHPQAALTSVILALALIFTAGLVVGLLIKVLTG